MSTQITWGQDIIILFFLSRGGNVPRNYLTGSKYLGSKYVHFDLSCVLIQTIKSESITLVTFRETWSLG